MVSGTSGLVLSIPLTHSLADLLLKAQQLKALDTPSNRDYRSVLHFMENDGGQLYKKDMEFIYEKEDLVTLRPGREHAWLDGLLERILRVLRCRLIRVGFLNMVSSQQDTNVPW
jgi:predicted nucleic acid-binding Zn ribbon protein